MLLMFGLLLIFAGVTVFIVVMSAIAFCLTCDVDQGPQHELLDPSGFEQPMRDPEHSCCSDRY